MKAEDRIIEAIRAALKRGIHLTRGPVFDWCTPGNWRAPRRALPYSCNAIGAILLFLGKEQLVGPDVYTGFAPGWHKVIENYLEVNMFWTWRFCAGFDGGYQITLTVVDKDGKEKVRKDDVSALGISIRKQFAAVMI